MREAIDALKRHLAEVADLESASRLIEWDECIYMPPGSARAHTSQKTTLARLAHEKFTSLSVGKLLDELLGKAAGLPYDSDDAALIRVTKREYDRAVRIPPGFVARLEEHKSRCYDAWCRAREDNDFSAVAPFLQTSVDLSREYAGFFPGYRHVADPLIEERDPGMTVSILRPVFDTLRAKLIPLLKAILDQPGPDDSFLHRRYPKRQQIRFGQGVIERCGYDFMRGRQDLSLHPFTINMSLDDVRITTSVNEYSFFESFSSTLHEAGHAMYEQGISGCYERSPLGKAASMGLHESQARLWENVIGRSRGFWSYFFPLLQAVFPEQLHGVTLEGFHRAINKVKPSLKRTEADEVTYNLHVMIRFDLELELLEGTLDVQDLPEAWAARYASDLKVAPRNCSDGVLQDVHWYYDLFGGCFQSYTIGNVIGAACFDAATRAHPEIIRNMEGGDFASLLSWLRDNIYRHGSRYTSAELVRSVAGEEMPLRPYLAYLQAKYAELYDLEPSARVAPKVAQPGNGEAWTADGRQSWT